MKFLQQVAEDLQQSDKFRQDDEFEFKSDDIESLDGDDELELDGDEELELDDELDNGECQCNAKRSSKFGDDEDFDFGAYDSLDDEDLDDEVRESILEYDNFILFEAVNLPADNDANIIQVMKMMDGARKGLSIVNKMEDGAFKAKHLSNIMVNMNKIRGLLARVMKKLESDINQKPSGVMHPDEDQY